MDFDPNADIPSVVPVWVCLPKLPLPYWGDGCLESIGIFLGKFLDKVSLNIQLLSCARICVEVDLEKGLPKEIIL